MSKVSKEIKAVKKTATKAVKKAVKVSTPEAELIAAQTAHSVALANEAVAKAAKEVAP